MFSTFNGSNQLFARTTNGNIGTDELIPGNWLGAPHRYRIDWQITSVAFWIDGTLVATHAIDLGPSLRPVASDANGNGSVLSIDWMRMSAYAPSGTFVSRIFDAGTSSDWVRSVDLYSAGRHRHHDEGPGQRRRHVRAVQLIAPITSGAAVGVHSRFLQYQAELTTTVPGVTPVIEDVTIGLMAAAPANTAPVANGDSFTINEDTALTVPAPGVIANDTDVDGDPLVATLVAGPAHGALAFHGDGSFSYTPAANFNGIDSFTYRVSDTVAASNLAIVSITVNAVNDPPTAAPDSYSTNENTALFISAPGVLANDADTVEGSPLTAQLVSSPVHGHLTLNANGSFSYTPDADYNGPDAFSYKASDGHDTSNTVTVTLTVNPADDAPVATNQSATTAEDTAIVLSLSASDVDSASLTFSVSSGPAHGTLGPVSAPTCMPLGTGSTCAATVTYTPTANYNGSDSFSFRANDGIVASNAATASVTVTPVNDAPAANAQSVTTPEDTAKAITLSGTDADGDALTFAVGTPTHGTLSGTAPNLTYAPTANYNGPDSFTFTVNDGTVTSAPGTVSITVTAVNDAPVDDRQTVTTTRTRRRRSRSRDRRRGQSR